MKIKLKRGTQAQNAVYLGEAGEVTINQETKTLHIHDGSKVGGYPVQPDEGKQLKLRGVGDYGGDPVDSALDITLTGDDGDFGGDGVGQTSVVFDNKPNLGSDDVSKAYRFKGLSKDVLIKDGVGLFGNSNYKINLTAPSGLTSDYSVSFPAKGGNVVVSDTNKDITGQVNTITLGNTSTGDGSVTVSARGYDVPNNKYGPVANTFQTTTKAQAVGLNTATLGGIILRSRIGTNVSIAAVYAGSRNVAKTSFESDTPIDFKVSNVIKLSVETSGAVVSNGNSIRFTEASSNGTNYTDVVGQANLTENNTVTLPATTGTLVTRENLLTKNAAGALTDIHASSSLRAPYVEGNVVYADSYIMGENSIITYGNGSGSASGVVLKPIIGVDSGSSLYINNGFMIDNVEDSSGSGLLVSEFQGLVVRDGLSGSTPTETKVLADGIILQAPNGSKWKVTVSNTGTLAVTVV